MVGKTTMIDDADAWLVAEGLLIAHGAGALRECEAALARTRAEADAVGEQNWQKIMTALRTLQTQA